MDGVNKIRSSKREKETKRGIQAGKIHNLPPCRCGKKKSLEAVDRPSGKVGFRLREWASQNDMGEPKLILAWFAGFWNFWFRVALPLRRELLGLFIPCAGTGKFIVFLLAVAEKRKLWRRLAIQSTHWISLNQQGWKMQETTAAKRQGGLVAAVRLWP